MPGPGAALLTARLPRHIPVSAGVYGGALRGLLTEVRVRSRWCAQFHHTVTATKQNCRRLRVAVLGFFSAAPMIPAAEPALSHGLRGGLVSIGARQSTPNPTALCTRSGIF